MSKSKSQAAPKGQEPPMYIQRPSSGHSQDVQHILAKAFRHVYTRDAIRLDTVNNLQVSKGSNDPYHENYVERLQEVYTEWQQRMDEIAMLERHIMQAQAKAMSAEERELNKATISCDNFKELGLPPVRSQFRSCIDTQLLHDYNLLAPSDYLCPDPLPVSAPKEPKMPAYARETATFRRHSRLDQIKPKTAPGHMTGESMELELSFSDGDIQDGTRKQQEKREKKDNFSTKHELKKSLSAEQRESDNKYLGMLQAKTNFLRNPRHLPCTLPTNVRSALKASDKSLKLIDAGPEQQIAEASCVVFLPSPPVVEFNNYKVGEVYEITLELKNVSAVMRQCRAIPPSSNVFSIGLGQFPGDSGLVAPGMSCTYGIRFTPYSLRNYDDFITIQMQATHPLVIPLTARRPPPVLTIPNEIDVGSCLVGGILSVHLVLKNEGGHSRFCLMPRNKWPTASIRSVLPNIMKLTIKQPPFEIYPATFELAQGQSVALEVIFNPQVEKSHVQEMVLACDNCQISHFKLKGEGETARVNLESVEMGLAEPMPGEFVDVGAKNLVKFVDLNPFTYTDRVIKISNCTKTELRYQWMIYKPILTTCFFDGHLGNVAEEERVPDLQSSFSVFPSNGVLLPSQIAEFRLTFAPATEGDFHSVAHLLLQNVPPQRKTASHTHRRPTLHDTELQLNDDNYNIFDPGVLPFKDVTALTLEMKGKGIPLNVVLHPYALIIQAPVLKGSTVKKMFTMANHSYSSITFRWEPYTESYFIEIEPPFGDLEPGMAMDFDISVTGVQPGKISHTLLCHILNVVEPLRFLVQADIKGPELKIEQPSISFGLIRVGQWESREMTIVNISETVVKCTIFDSPVDQESEEPEVQSELKFSDTSCELQPFGRKTITITMMPTAARSIRRICYVQYEGDQTCSVGVYGEAQNPVVCFLECHKFLPEVYLEVPLVFTVVLHNQTLLPTTFKWGKAHGSECGDCKIEVLEPEGEILSWQQKTVSISFTPLKAISFTDVTLPCHIAGQEDDIYINIDCDVKVLAVSFKVSTDDQLTDSLQLNFGDSVGLGEIVKRYVHISNETAISAPYSAIVENFPAPSYPHPEVTGTDTVASQKHILLSRTPTVSGPERKTEAKIKQEHNKMMLSKKAGAAFVVHPSHGHLQPFGTQIIEISAHNDLWGNYHDNLICQVGELEQVKIPMDLNVIGCPLNFQITSGLPGKEGTVRFGSHNAGTNTITRKLKINNSSPNDIRVDWKIFKRDDSSNKVVDLITFFGDAFPKGDIFGTEISQAGSTNVSESIVEERISALPAPGINIINQRTPSALQTSEITTGISSRENKKIVFCYLQPHDGIRIKTPFHMKPSQMVIPARGSSIAKFTFTPLSTRDVTEEMDFIGYARGFLNLDSENSSSDKVERPEGYFADQLNINFTAHLKPALLTLEELEDDGMRFSAAISDIVKDNEIQKEFLHIRSIKLTNDNLTPLTFKLKVKEPFLLIDLDPSSTEDGTRRAMETLLCILNPRQYHVSKVAFCVTVSLLPESSPQSANSQMALSKMQCFEDVLSIEFENGVIQRVPLYATVTIPEMEISVDYLDFGTCLVGQTRELHLEIFNKTASHSYWWIRIENKSITCDDDTFQVQPQNGMLEAQIMYTSKSKVLLKVFFTAKHSDTYDCTFIVQGMLGECQRRILVVGQGSYDGKHEAILDV